MWKREAFYNSPLANYLTLESSGTTKTDYHRARSHNLVEAEAGGGVGEHVGVDGVRDVRLPVGDGALLGGETLG